MLLLTERNFFDRIEPLSSILLHRGGEGSFVSRITDALSSPQRWRGGREVRANAGCKRLP